ncbi:MAG: hypothetical protein A4E72_00119 [Syntrophus sp. PtaU1.Bin208]|nr:MAG: hypothetical protein A4E72_00119 [Syntrophus sp. PtaU1.Bin208]
MNPVVVASSPEDIRAEVAVDVQGHCLCGPIETVIAVPTGNILDARRSKVEGLPGRPAYVNPIVTAAAADAVIAAAGVDRVVAAASVKAVIASIAVKRVVAVAAVDVIVEVAALEGIGAQVAVDRQAYCLPGPIETVIAVSTGDPFDSRR